MGFLAWLVTMQRDGGGEEGSVGGRRTAVTSHHIDGGRLPLGADWFSSGSGGGDQVLDEDQNVPSSPPPFCLGQSGDTFFLFCLGGFFVCYSRLAFGLVLRLIRPFFRFCFIVGFLDCC